MKTEILFKKKLDEVFFLEPNQIGPNLLNTLFKDFSANFKKMPFLIIIPFSLLLSLISYFLFNSLIIKLVSLLQYGF